MRYMIRVIMRNGFATCGPNPTSLLVFMPEEACIAALAFPRLPISTWLGFKLIVTRLVVSILKVWGMTLGFLVP